MEFTSVTEVTAPGGGITTKAFADNPVDTRNLATRQRSLAVRQEAQEKQDATHAAFLAVERAKDEAQARRAGFGEFGELFSMEKLAKIAGDFIKTYAGAEAGGIATDLLGGFSGKGPALPEFDFGSFESQYDAMKANRSGMPNVELRASNFQVGGAASLGSLRGIDNGFREGKGKPDIAFTPFSTATNVGMGALTFRAPEMSFKMPIGKGENYEL